MITNLLLAVLAAGVPAFAADSAPKPDAAAAAASAAAGRRFSERCAKAPLAVDALLKDAAARADMSYLNGDESRDLFDYSVCRAIQSGPAACSPLEGLGRLFQGSAGHCRTAEAEARFAFATLRGGDAQAACRALLELDGKRGASDRKDCAAMVSAVRGGGEKMSCASLKSAGLVVPQDSCEDMQNFWSGNTSACGRLKDPPVRRECLRRAALVAGLREPAKCSDSPACRALSKSPAACDGLLESFSAGVCARASRDVAAERKRLAQEAEQRKRAELQAKELTEKQAAAKAAAAAAAVTAKAAAADAKAKAEFETEQQKVARLAALQAAKTAQAEAAIKAKAEAEAKKSAAAKAKIAKEGKVQFAKGQPMEATPPEALEIIKAVEEGRPIPVKRKPKPEQPAPATDE